MIQERSIDKEDILKDFPAGKIKKNLYLLFYFQ